MLFHATESKQEQTTTDKSQERSQCAADSAQFIAWNYFSFILLLMSLTNEQLVKIIPKIYT